MNVSAFEVENEIVFAYFDRLSNEERDDQLFRALYIGVLALMEDRFAAFLARTQSELGTQLESLKLIFEMKREIFLKTAVKGAQAEETVIEALSEYCKERGLKDVVQFTGTTTGALPRNKTGDAVCFVDGDDSRRVVIECKFDKSVRLGDISDRDPFARGSDTAWSQLLEAHVNRGAAIAIIVFDYAVVDRGVLEFVQSVRFEAPVGFMVLVDSQKGDFGNLFIAYALARDIALHAKTVQLDGAMLDALVRRLIRDLNAFTSVRSLVERNIETSREIMRQLERSWLMVEFCQAYLGRFLKEGRLSQEDLLEFYQAEEVRERYKPLEKEILSLGEKGLDDEAE